MEIETFKKVSQKIKLLTSIDDDRHAKYNQKF